MTNAELAATIEKHVRPATFPVAVKLTRPGESLPPRCKRPREDLGFETAICQAVGLSRRYGWTLAIANRDVSCPIARAYFGFEPAVEFLTGGHTCAGMYTADAEAGKRTEAAIPRFEHGRFEHFICGALARVEYDWDVVIVYGNSAQVMRLVAGALYNKGGVMTSQTAGRVDCADLVISAMNSGDCRYVLPCYGDRVFGGTTDEEMAFSFPRARAEQLVTGLEGTHKGGVRYPIPTFLRFTAEFPESYRRLADFWRSTSDRG